MSYHYNPSGPTRGQLRPRYSQSFSNWLTGVGDYSLPYEYQGLPGEYGWTPESLLEYYGMTNIPGQGDYGEFAGILPTYWEGGENFMLQQYILDMYGIGRGQEIARRTAGEAIADPGMAPLHGFEEAGVDIATKTAERDTIANIMEEVAETANIGRGQAEWALGSKLRGERAGFTEDVVDAYNRWYNQVVKREEGGEVFDYITNEQAIDAACQANPDLPICWQQYTGDLSDLDWSQAYECGMAWLRGEELPEACQMGVGVEEDWGPSEELDTDPLGTAECSDVCQVHPDPDACAGCLAEENPYDPGTCNGVEIAGTCMTYNVSTGEWTFGFAVVPGLMPVIWAASTFWDQVADAWNFTGCTDANNEPIECPDNLYCASGSGTYPCINAEGEPDCCSHDTMWAGDTGLGVTGDCWDTGCDEGYTCDMVTGECFED